MFRRFLGPMRRMRSQRLRRPRPQRRRAGRPAPRPRPPPPARSSPASTRCRRAEARYLACFAYVMSRAAQADLDISEEETALMERFAVEYGGLDEAQAVLVVEMAKIQASVEGATEDYVVTREFREISTLEQRLAAAALLLRGRGGRRDDQRRGGVGRQRDRARARHRAGRPERGPRRVPRAALVGPGAAPGRRLGA